MEIIHHVKDILLEGAEQSEIIRSGYKSLDSAMLGFRKREVSLFASTPGVGKTAMLLNIALRMAKLDTPVLFITYETTSYKIAQKLLGILSNVDPFILEQGRLSDEVKEKTALMRNKLDSMPVYISESFVFQGDILTKEAMMLKEHGIKAVIIDSLQFFTHSRHESVEDRNMENVMFLKQFARENDVALLLSTQIRSKDIPQGKMPTITDIGGEEELADMVFILTRPYAYSVDQYVGDIEEFIVQLAKNRNGPSGAFKLLFSRRTLSIIEREEKTFS